MLEVFRSSNISAFATVRGDDALLIGFSFHHELRDGMGQLGRLDRENAFSCSIVDFSCLMRFPYPVEEVAAALQAVGAFARGFRRVFTFGGSLAGFLAINFASHLGADVAIAGSPPFSLDPRKMPGETRWGKYRAALSDYPWDDIGKGLACLHAVYLIYDPASRDAVHAQAIADLARSVRRMPLRYSSHPATRVLEEGGRLSGILSAIVDGRLTDADFRKAFRESRRRSPSYLRKLAAALPARRRAVQIRLLEMALALDPSVVGLVDMLAPLAELGRLSEARALAQPLSDRLANYESQIATLKEKNARLKRQLADLEARIEKPEEEPSAF